MFLEVFICFILSTTQVFAQRCQVCLQGISLKNNVFESHFINDLNDCHEKCISVPKCRSFNWYRKTVKCELNNMTASILPNMTVKDPGSVYFEVLRSSASPDQPAESCRAHCSSYTTIKDLTRLTSYTDQTRAICDRDYIKKKWYRFEGTGQNKMPTACVTAHRCNTHAPGWLQAGHPTTKEGLVTRKVCFHWMHNCCKWNSFIQVCNCGSYYVYEFVPTKVCRLRYCSVP